MGERNRKFAEAMGFSSKKKKKPEVEAENFERMEFEPLISEKNYDEAKKRARIYLDSAVNNDGLDESTPVLWAWTEKEFDAAPEVATIAELRFMVDKMDDKDVGPGWPAFGFQVSNLSAGEEFARREREVVRDCKSALAQLDKFGPLDDDAVIWVCSHSKVGKPYQTTPKDWRRKYENVSYAVVEAEDQIGGVSIISADPNFDIKEWDKDNAGQQFEVLGIAVDAVHRKDNLLEGLEKLKSKKLIRLYSTKTGESVVLAPKQMFARIQSLSAESLAKNDFILTEPEDEDMGNNENN